MSNKTLVLIDGHALLYRAFFSFPASLSLPSGQLTNAAYGFIRMLLSTLTELKPSHLAVSFDVGKTFRHAQFKEYKAHREKMPEELRSQEPIVQELLNELNIPIYSMLDYEADDVIGTVALQATNENRGSEMADQVLIVSGDRDLWQLITDRVRVFIPGGGRRESRVIDREATKAGLGVWPEQVPDYKGLAGDASDNIPGVAGVGPKTAAALIADFGSLEQVYAYIESLEKHNSGAARISAKVVEKLVRDKEQALLSKELSTIKTDVPLSFSLNACLLSAYDKDKATAALLKYGFKSLLPALPVDQFEAAVQDALF